MQGQVTKKARTHYEGFIESGPCDSGIICCGYLVVVQGYRTS